MELSSHLSTSSLKFSTEWHKLVLRNDKHNLITGTTGSRCREVGAGQGNLEVGNLSPDSRWSESNVGQRDWNSFWWCDGKTRWAQCVWWSWHYSQRTKAPGVLVKTSALAQMAVFVPSKKNQPGNGLWGHNFSFLLTGPISRWVKGTLVVTSGEVVARTLVSLWPRLWQTWLWRSPSQGLVLSLGSIVK